MTHQQGVSESQCRGISRFIRSCTGLLPWASNQLAQHCQYPAHARLEQQMLHAGYTRPAPRHLWGWPISGFILRQHPFNLSVDNQVKVRWYLCPTCCNRSAHVSSSSARRCSSSCSCSTSARQRCCRGQKQQCLNPRRGRVLTSQWLFCAAEAKGNTCYAAAHLVTGVPHNHLHWEMHGHDLESRIGQSHHACMAETLNTVISCGLHPSYRPNSVPTLATHLLGPCSLVVI